jgi:hypothetical protein
MSFAESIEKAQSKPDGTDFDPGNLFKGKTPTPGVVTEEASPDRVPGVPSYALEFFARRFYMGRELSEIDGSTKIFTDRDESAEFIRIQNMCMQGKAIELRRLEGLSMEGNVTIWLEWGEQREVEVPRPEDRDYLTEEELKGPTLDPVQRALAVLRKAADDTANSILKDVADAVDEARAEDPPEETWGEPSDGQGPEEEDTVE